MGCCLADERKVSKKSSQQLQQLFSLDNEDLLKKGTQKDFLNQYEVLEQETQSHLNCVTSLVTEKATGETKFCKTILKQNNMSMSRINTTCFQMSSISHQLITKVQEVYVDKDRVYLIIPFLRKTHKQLSELSITLDEIQVTVIIQKLLQLCAHLHQQGITIANLHPNNVFIDEDYPEDVLVTDAGFIFMPSMDPVTKM